MTSDYTEPATRPQEELLQRLQHPGPVRMDKSGPRSVPSRPQRLYVVVSLTKLLGRLGNEDSWTYEVLVS